MRGDMRMFSGYVRIVATGALVQANRPLALAKRIFSFGVEPGICYRPAGAGPSIGDVLREGVAWRI